MFLGTTSILRFFWIIYYEAITDAEGNFSIPNLPADEKTHYTFWNYDYKLSTISEDDQTDKPERNIKLVCEKETYK